MNEYYTLLENEYLAKIIGFCYMKTNSNHEAEDLSSDITLQIVKYINSGKEIGNFNAFVWKVCNNVLCKYLRDKKYSGTFYMTELIPSTDNIESEFIVKEQNNKLYEEISLLSQKYRDTIVLHYFEGKSCEEISLRLNKSVGTVKWWLSEARNFIKEGMNMMREYGEKSYRPDTLAMSCQGQYGADFEPMTCVKRKSTQNILLAAYKEPLSIEELCLELGISAPYIEDEVNYLVENQLMKEVGKDKYQTDFVILPSYNIGVPEEVYNTCFPGYFNELIALLEANKSLLMSKKFNTANFTWERLLWVYIHMITDLNLSKFKCEQCNIITYEDTPERPNGGKWIALGYKREYNYTRPKSENLEAYIPYDGPVHKSAEYVQGFFHNWSGLDSTVFFQIREGVFALCSDIIEGKQDMKNINENEKYLFSIAIEKKLFIKTGDNFYNQNYYYIGESEFEQIRELAYGFYDTATNYFSKAFDIVLRVYKEDIPKHLQWQMSNFLSNHLNGFITCSLYEAVNKNLLSTPDVNNKKWLSLFAVGN
jgi:RNA polymerase sigma factor, sigma-70 family